MNILRIASAGGHDARVVGWSEHGLGHAFVHPTRVWIFCRVRKARVLHARVRTRFRVPRAHADKFTQSAQAPGSFAHRFAREMATVAPSAAMSSRRRMWIAMRPPTRVTVNHAATSDSMLADVCRARENERGGREA